LIAGDVDFHRHELNVNFYRPSFWRFVLALETKFGWSRTAMSGAFTLARGEGAVLGPLEGVLIDKFGSRRLILIGYCIMGLGFIFLSCEIRRQWRAVFCKECFSK